MNEQRKIRIEIDGSQAKLFWEDTGEEIQGVYSYTVKHSAGLLPEVSIKQFLLTKSTIRGELYEHIITCPLCREDISFTEN
jgi:hypothetical protein